MKSVSIAPSDNFTKYMHLGQLLSGPDALQAYGRGVALIDAERAKVQSGEVGRGFVLSVCEVVSLSFWHLYVFCSMKAIWSGYDSSTALRSAVWLKST